MIECFNYRKINDGHFLGFADLYIDDKWGTEVYGCKLFQKDGRRWVNLPQQEYEKDGQKAYSNVVRIRKKDQFPKFQELAKQAIDKYCLSQGSEKKEEEFNEEVPF